MSEANKALVRRFYEEVWNKGTLDAADAIFADDYVRHDLRPGDAPAGPEGQKLVAGMFRTAFPDVPLSVEFMVSEADMVVARWMMRGTHQGAWGSISPTGKQMSFAGVNIFSHYRWQGG
jgi:predicted ester cyclase